MYLRQVTVMLGLIILCMVLLGAGFFSLSYRHQLEESKPPWTETPDLFPATPTPPSPRATLCPGRTLSTTSTPLCA